MNVHVVGGSGFLGGRVIARLVGLGHRVTAIARSPAAAGRSEAAGAEPMSGDLDVPGDVERTMSSSAAEALLTCVPLGMGHGPAIVAAAEAAGVRRGVFVSTTSIFTKLSTASKAVRLAAEERIGSSSLDWTIVRPTMIYGAPGDRNIERLLRLLSRSPVVPLPGGGRGLQQPVHVDDLAGLLVAALLDPVAVGKTYDVAGPEPLTLRRLVGEASAALGRRVIVVPVPLRPVVSAAVLYERLGGSRLRPEQFERLAEDKAFDISSARRDLGFAPRSFEDGIRAEAAALFGS